MSLKYYPSISWERVRKIMTNEFRIQTSNLLFVHIAVHLPSAKR
jgi:hypothetical protein